jgi:LAO/AO transport system kinase
MNKWYSHPGVYIRSLASRGNAGGVNPRIIEITSLVQCAGFDYIIIETVGTGQNEVEIAGIADVTVVVLVPDSGDDIQALKSGLMEIADIFVVNKSDRPAADIFTKNLRNTLAVYKSTVPVMQTIATSQKNIQHLAGAIEEKLSHISGDKKISLLAHKAFYLIREMRMSHISKEMLREEILSSINRNDFNFYSFVAAHV